MSTTLTPADDTDNIFGHHGSKPTREWERAQRVKELDSELRTGEPALRIWTHVTEMWVVNATNAIFQGNEGNMAASQCLRVSSE